MHKTMEISTALPTLMETDLETLLPSSFFLDLIPCAVVFFLSYFLFNPKLTYYFLQINQTLMKSVVTESNMENLSDHDLMSLARKRSQIARSLCPIVILCAVVLNYLSEPYNWLFAIIFGPLLAFSYYKVVGSIMDLQEPDDKTSDEKTD